MDAPSPHTAAEENTVTADEVRARVLAEMVDYFTSLDQAARDGKDEAYPSDGMRQRPTRWCGITSWMAKLAREYAEGHRVDVPDAVTRAAGLEKDLAEARRFTAVLWRRVAELEDQARRREARQ